MDLRNPFALLGNRIITIYDLDESMRGLKCNCVCPNCKAPFEAKMGDVRQWHFAHSGTPCDSVKLYVNACYWFVRQILLENKGLKYPGLSCHGEQLFEDGLITTNSIEISYNKDELAIGLIINNNDLAVRLLLDIDYCVEEIKRPLDGLSTLLIDFRNIQFINTGGIINRLCNELYGKRWIYSIAEERHKNAAKEVGRSDNIDFSNSYKRGNESPKEYRQPIVTCMLCKKKMHKDDVMRARNHNGYICHKCIETKGLNWREI